MAACTNRPFLVPLLLLWAAQALPAADTRLVRETEALTPEQERAALHVLPGFEIQLFAAEPQINKPINMAFDARGRLWVSSTVEYPYCADKSRWSDERGTRVKDSRDAIKILEDTDGDGRADKVTDFADGLNIPTGVLPWRRPGHKAGCIAWSIPNIWYFGDSDGDDQADVREVLFGPLGYEKDTHGMCSSFRLGLDGWVYATHGFNNTSHIQARDGTRLELHSGNVFRFRPDGSRVEIWSRGQVNPFGLCWDKHQNLYSADCHSSPVYQLLRGAHYPSFGKPHDGLGFGPVMCEHTHGSTGICGIIYLDGGVWGPEWDDHLFLGNVVTSRVNHDHVTFTGATPKANEQPDFITSDDPWFRPVDLQLGPDNALYIADFYNRIIGHYEVPLDHPGRDRERGRIWRVVKTGLPAAAKPRLVSSGTALEHAVHPNTTVRHLAHQELMFHHGPKPEVLLAPTAPHVMQLWLQDPQNAVRRQNGAGVFLHLARPFSGEDAGLLALRLQRIAELGFADEQQRASACAAMAGATARTRPWFLAALQARPALESLPALLALEARIEPGDATTLHAWKLALREHLALPGAFEALPPAPSPAVRSIILAVPSEAAAGHLAARLKTGGPAPDGGAAALGHIARHGTPAHVDEAVAWARRSAPEPVQALKALQEGLSERGQSAGPELLAWAQTLAGELLARQKATAGPSWRAVPQKDKTPEWALRKRRCADGAEVEVLQSMATGGAKEESRVGVLSSKVFTAPARLTFWLNGHRGPPQSPPHDRNLVRLVEAESGKVLFTAFPPRHDACVAVAWDLGSAVGKPVRFEVVDGDRGAAYAWLGVGRFEPPVLEVESFRSESADQEALRTLATLLQHTAPVGLRDQLSAYLPPRPASPPPTVSPQQRQALDQLIAARAAAFQKGRPDVEMGGHVFGMNCAACHRVAGEGGLVGPQLDGIGTRGLERLCEDILDPNRNVDAHFHLHIITLKSGATLSGFLKAEAGQVLILADAAGQEQRVPKAEVARDQVTPMSLMPPTFGESLAEDDFVNLLGWLLKK